MFLADKPGLLGKGFGNICAQVVTAMYVRHKTIEASKSLVEEVSQDFDVVDPVPGGLVGGHRE